jgi:hypothetical protein
MIEVLVAAVGHDYEELVYEVAREIGIENHHIAELGPPALLFAIGVGVVTWLVRSS